MRYVRLLDLQSPFWLRFTLFAACVIVPLLGGCAGAHRARVDHAIDTTVIPLMERERIPGIAVGVVHGNDTILRCFGVASRESGSPVDANTLFEIGSISKTFTALLGAKAAIDGDLQLTDPVSTHVPELIGSPLGRVTMLQLATYTAGGLPLQVPSEVTESSLISFFSAWTPEFPAGTHRQYSNPSIGFFGRVSASAAGRDFSEMMTNTILPGLGMRDTYLSVTPAASERYAFGYTKDDRPVRVNPGVLDAEAYGIKTSASDLCLYIRAQFKTDESAPLARAIALSHQGDYSIGPMTQALGWEYYAYPTTLDDLLRGNSPETIFNPNQTEPRRELTRDVLYNKTGSTNGFSAYVVFVPAKRIGVVLLANKACPIADRIKVAHSILRSLDPDLAAPQP